MCSYGRTSKPQIITYKVTEPSYLRAQASTAPEFLANSSRLPHFKRPPMLSCVKHCMRPPLLSSALKAASASAAATAKAGKRGQESSAAPLKKTLLQPTSSTKLSATASEARVKCSKKRGQVLASSKSGNLGRRPQKRDTWPCQARLQSQIVNHQQGCKGLPTLARLALGRSCTAQLGTGTPQRRMLVQRHGWRLGCHRRHGGRWRGMRASGWLQGLAKGQNLGGGGEQLLHRHKARLLEQRACGSSMSFYHPVMLR